MRGKTYLYWRDDAAIAADRPTILLCQRAEIRGDEMYLHGRGIAEEPDHDQIVGEPCGRCLHQIPGARLVKMPEPGCCTEVF